MVSQVINNEMNLNDTVWKNGKQGHLFNFLTELTEEQRNNLLGQLKDLPEPAELAKRFKAAVEADEKCKEKVEMVPVAEADVVDIGATEESKLKKWRERGLMALKSGQVAIVTLAGGQGTRLGSSKPKGCYDIGLPSKSSLFQIQAERIRRLEQLAGPKEPLAWYIMTSAPTHADTEEFFKANNFFGLKAEQVKFFQQGVLPAFDANGKIFMAAKDKIAVAPDGNGGIYAALQKQGILCDFERKGVKYVHMYCVDNCLVKVGDPTFIGAAIEAETDCGAKVVEKTEPSESVGVFCRRAEDGKMIVAEYSELDPKVAQAVDEKSGKLKFGEANIANHVFTVEFLKAIAGSANLPYHIARKKIPSIDPESGEVVSPPPMGIKLEAFIFDVFERAAKPILFRVKRNDEFAPLKNAPGTPKDSPEFCAGLLYNLHKRYLLEAGAEIGAEVAQLEISPKVTYDGEGLEGFKGRQLNDKQVLIN